MHMMTKLTVPFALVLGAAFASGNALAGDKPKKECPLTIEGNDAMQFSTKELSVGKDCTDVKLTLKHVGKLPKQAMGHNWVLVKTADKDGIIKDAGAAGVANDYVPKGDKRVIAHTKLIGGGESDTVTFSLDGLKAGEAYTYLCTFPGHFSMMVGTFSIK